MTACAVKSCKNYTGKKKKCKNITFHKFPTDPVAAHRWTEIIRRARNESCWKPKPKTSICSAHFHDKDVYTTNTGRRKILSGAVPTQKLYISSTKSDDVEEQSSSEEREDQNVNEADASAEIIDEVDFMTNENDQELSAMYLESIFCTEEEVKLRKLLRKQIACEINLVKKIKLLQAKNRRLYKSTANFKRAIATLKYQKKSPPNKIHR